MSTHRTLNRRTFVGGMCLSAVTVTLAACGANETSGSATASGTAQATGTKGGTIHVLNSVTSIDFDPAKSTDMPMSTLSLVHRRLTNWRLVKGKEVEIIPDLATDTGTVSSDGLSWTFTLRDGLTYEDGSSITAADVKYGVERTFASSLSGGLTYHKTLLADTDGYEGPYNGKHLSSVEATDDKTIVFHLNRTFGDFPWIAGTPAFCPVPEAHDDPQTFGIKPFASGPYKMGTYQEGVQITLERNDEWKQSSDDLRTALPDSFVYELGQDESTIAQRLIASSGDDANAFGRGMIAAAQLAQVSADASAKARLATSPDGGPLQYLAINTERVTDLDVRKAIAYAVDKEAVVSALGGSLGAVQATTYITPGIPGREEYDLYPTDADKAKSLLSGKDVPDLTLLVANDAASQAVGEAVQQSLTDLGLKVTLDPVESTTYTERATQSDGSAYDLAVASWNPDYPSANANIQPLYASSEIGGGGYNISRFADDDVYQAIDEAAANLDTDAAKAQWAAIDKQIAEKVPSVPLAYRRNSFLPGSGVTGFFVNSFPSYPSYLVVGATA